MTPITPASDVLRLLAAAAPDAVEIDFRPMAGWQDLVVAAAVLVGVALMVIGVVTLHAWRSTRFPRRRAGDGPRDVPSTP